MIILPLTFTSSAFAARAFDLLELPRYAAICRSATTAEALDAYERSDREGKRAFLKADEASWIRPPDLAELAWGSVMGWEESRRCRRPQSS